MTAPRQIPDHELLDYAEAYALHALDEHETRDVEAALDSANEGVRAHFDARVRDALETMSTQASSYAEQPDPLLFERILSDISGAEPGVTRLRRDRRNRQLFGAAAAAAVVVALAAGVVIGRVSAPEPPTTSGANPDAVLAAPDARTGQARVGEATITFVYSRQHNSGVVLMSDVPPPTDGSVYQMWLMDADGAARSRGTMTRDDVRPTTTATLPGIDGATSFGITVERPGGAATPSTDRAVVTIPIS